MGIKFDPNFEKEMLKTVQEFNAKVYKLQNKGVKKLPELITVEDLKASYVNRRDLQRRLESLRRFSAKGVEDLFKTEGGVVMSKYQFGELQRDLALARRRVNKEFKAISQKEMQNQYKSERFLMLQRERAKLSVDARKLNKAELDSLTHTTKKYEQWNTKQQAFKQSFKEMIENGYSMALRQPRKIDELKFLIDKLDADTLNDLISDKTSGIEQFIYGYHEMTAASRSMKQGHTDEIYEELYRVGVGDVDSAYEQVLDSLWEEAMKTGKITADDLYKYGRQIPKNMLK